MIRTDQFDDLDEHPVVGGGGHQFEEGGCKGEIVLGVLASQFTDHTHCCTLHTYTTTHTSSQITLTAAHCTHTQQQHTHTHVSKSGYDGKNVPQDCTYR